MNNKLIIILSLLCSVIKGNHTVTLSMIVKNEADRYLPQVLIAAREYIHAAVIIDDGSTDNTMQVCRELLQGIPLILIENNQSKFHNEITLRMQQWNETINTNPEWILFLDADEIFEESFKNYLPNLLSQYEYDVFFFRLYDFWNMTHYREDQYWYAHQTYRPFLLRYNKDFNYIWPNLAQHCGRMPQNVGCLKVGYSHLRLKHYGWAKYDDRVSKYNRYMTLDPEAKYGWKEQYDSILDANPHLIEWHEQEAI